MLKAPFDWDIVDEVSAWHFDQERAYGHRLIRWVLAHRGESGVISMENDSLDVLSGQLELKRIRAILPNGCLVEAMQPDMLISGSYDRASILSETPVWLTYTESLVEKRDQAGGTVKITQHKLFLEAKLEPQHNTSLQIGQLSKRENFIAQYREYIPRCVSLESCPVLKEEVKKLSQLTYECLNFLKDNRTIAEKAVVCTLMQSLIPVAKVVNWRISPEEYFERIVWMLQTHVALLPLTVTGSDPRPARLADECLATMAKIASKQGEHRYSTEIFAEVSSLLERTKPFYRLGSSQASHRL